MLDLEEPATQESESYSLNLYIKTKIASTWYVLLLATHHRDLVEQVNRLSRIGDPSGRACQSSFEVVGAGGQKLITHVQRSAALDAAKVLLASHDAPGFVANVDEDVVAAWN